MQGCPLKGMHAGQGASGASGPWAPGAPGPPKISLGSSQGPRTPWQNIGQAKLKRLTNSHQNPLGFDLVRGCFTFLPASGRPEAGRRLSIYLSICLPIYLYLSIYLSVYLYSYLS